MIHDHHKRFAARGNCDLQRQTSIFLPLHPSWPRRARSVQHRYTCRYVTLTVLKATRLEVTVAEEWTYDTLTVRYRMF